MISFIALILFAARHGQANVVELKSFGAVGDGMADDTKAFANALAQTPAGSTLHIALGTYLVDPTTTPLILTSGTTISGDGDGSIVKVKDGVSSYKAVFSSSRPSALLSDVTFNNFVVDQNIAGTPGAEPIPHDVDHTLFVFSMYRFSNVRFNGIKFLHVGGINTINMNSPDGKNARIENCEFQWTKSTANPKNYDSSLIYISANGQAVKGCTFTAESSPGITAIEVHGVNMTIQNNKITNYSHGMNVVGFIGANTSAKDGEIEIDHNEIRASTVGINLWSLATRTLSSVAVQKNTITMTPELSPDRICQAIGTYRDGGKLVRGDYDGLTIEGNTITYEFDINRLAAQNRLWSYDDNAAIAVSANGVIKNVKIIDNVIDNPLHQGIVLGTTSADEKPSSLENVVVDNNRITNIYSIDKSPKAAAGVRVIGTVRSVQLGANPVTFHTSGKEIDSDKATGDISHS